MVIGVGVTLIGADTTAETAAISATDTMGHPTDTSVRMRMGLTTATVTLAVTTMPGATGIPTRIVTHRATKETCGPDLSHLIRTTGRFTHVVLHYR